VSGNLRVEGERGGESDRSERDRDRGERVFPEEKLSVTEKKKKKVPGFGGGNERKERWDRPGRKGNESVLDFL
jgi:hypothetical protein